MIKITGYLEISKSTNRTNSYELEQSVEETNPGQLSISMRKRVIERKIQAHREDGSYRLGDRKSESHTEQKNS